MLTTEKLSVAYGDNVIIPELDLSIKRGKITALIGPNGCGKSTLLKTLARINKASKGRVLLHGKPVKEYQDKILAQKISLLPQVLLSPEGISVRQLVEYGRSPYLSHWGKLNDADHQAVDRAMLDTQVDTFSERPLDSLSGGQRQRAWIAMVLAQDADIVMLDEPTTYLDLSHQIELMRLMQAMNKKGKTVIVVLHDLNQACRYCDELVVLKQGKLICQGSPEKVFTQTLLQEVFSLEAHIIEDPIAKTPMCIAC
jgi:iron complex transport system ATP-binding protein